MNTYTYVCICTYVCPYTYTYASTYVWHNTKDSVQFNNCCKIQSQFNRKLNNCPSLMHTHIINNHTETLFARVVPTIGCCCSVFWWATRSLWEDRSGIIFDWATLKWREKRGIFPGSFPFLQIKPCIKPNPAIQMRVKSCILTELCMYVRMYSGT